MATVAPLLIGISLILAALRQVVRIRRNWLDAHAMRVWPTVTGIVTESRVKHDAPYDDPDYSHAYIAVVRYEYTVDEIPYTSTDFADWDPIPEEQAQAIVARYPVGKRVRVYHDPLDPHASLLEPGAGFSFRGSLVLPLVGLLTGAILVFITVLQLL